ncbi:MAG: malonyl-ACP O-methyltransferase BioC [Gammaproteobacteria bacterium]|nr:malonyl-ACP O-methyltransferase BioC [Gammaproteobacteria bacterium]MDH3449298.1 malonyl-ACP O-methyltransferase BioC [Gammaproteobacteria bacterium]
MFLDLLNPPRLDKRSIKKFFNRAAKSYDNAAILQEEVLTRLLQRLQYIRHRPETIIDIGCGTGKGIPGLQKRYPRARVYAADIALEMLLYARSRYRPLTRKRLIAADMERLPFAPRSFDLVFSSLALQWANDLRATLAEFARIAKPGSLLMFASFGPGTLQELAASWEDLDRHPHVHQFVDMHDVGDAMLAAGFTNPVVDAERIRMEYGEFRMLLGDLKNIGATNAEVSRRRGLMTPAKLRSLEARYREHGFEDGKFVASYEVVYGHAWLE